MHLHLFARMIFCWGLLMVAVQQTWAAECGDKPPTPPSGIAQPAARLTAGGVVLGNQHEERDKQVVLRTEHCYQYRMFDVYPGASSGYSLRSREDGGKPDKLQGFMRFKVDFKTAGKWSVWFFSRVWTCEYAGNEFRLVRGCDNPYSSTNLEGMNCGDQYLEDQAGHMYSRPVAGRWAESGSKQFHWESRMKEGKTSKATGEFTPDESKCPCYEEADAKPPIMITIAKPGLINVDIIAIDDNWLMEKIVFKKENLTSSPSGTGPEETLSSTGVVKSVASVGVACRTPSVKAMIVAGRNPGLSFLTSGKMIDARGRMKTAAVYRKN